MADAADLDTVTAAQLAGMIIAEQDLPERTFAIVDVRDSDYLGGHIKGSIHVPVNSFDALLPTLIRKLVGKRTVVFHCALSQMRGPTSAKKYLAAKPADDGQEVVVLRDGFVGWQKDYGVDERLTEGWVRELWEGY